MGDMYSMSPRPVTGKYRKQSFLGVIGQFAQTYFADPENGVSSLLEPSLLKVIFS